MIEERSAYTWLIAAGALPFAFGGVMELAGVERLPIAGETRTLLLSYGLGIVSFLTGIHWAASLYLSRRSPLGLFAISNAVFLCVWLAFLLAPPAVSAIMQSAAFAILLGIDYRLLGAGIVAHHYFRMRTFATLIAIASLLTLL